MPIAADREPRVDDSDRTAKPTAGFPFFWAGYMLVDSGGGGVPDEPLAGAGKLAPGAQPANPPVGGLAPQPQPPAAAPQAPAGGNPQPPEAKPLRKALPASKARPEPAGKSAGK
jgi:hypothetical protein